MLTDFLATHRDEILARARLQVGARNAPAATEEELQVGLPLFLTQLGDALRRASSLESVDHDELRAGAAEHGRNLYEKGLTVGQVVHDYGDLCQIITSLAFEEKAAIATDEFQTLNLCLDDAIAGAVTSYTRLRDTEVRAEGTERLGVLAHEMRNLLNAALLSFASIKKGVVTAAGSTGAMHERSLNGLVLLIDRSLADVRLDAGVQNLVRVPVQELLEEVEIAAALAADARKLRLVVHAVDPRVVVLADRQILAAVVANLLQNAFKFTKPASAVSVTTTTTNDHVLISVEDECGGLPAGRAEELLLPYTQHGHDRSGLGLGLSICTKAAKAMGGQLHIRDVAGKGCIFTLQLPKQPPPPTSIHAHARGAGGKGGPGGLSAKAVGSS